MLKNIFLLVLLSIFTFFNTTTKSDVSIVVSIDQKIITNYDIQNEANYLQILNPDLKQLDKENILKLSKESLVREIIKKNEVEKVFDFSLENPFVNEYLKNLYTKLNFTNENEFNDYIINFSDYSLDDIKQKLKIEIAWNELIYLKYKNQINIDKEKLKIKINQLSDKTIKEYKLSEIVFMKRKNENLQDLISLIKSNIKEIGFNNTANIYSILRVLENFSDLDNRK